MLGERLGKGSGRERGGGFAMLRITGWEKAVASKTFGDEPDQIFHKGSRFSRTSCPVWGNGHAQVQPRNVSPEGRRGASRTGG